MTEREALKLALEALESCGCDEVGYSYNEALTVSAIAAIKEALAQPEQEPVGFTIQAEIDYAKNNPKEYAGFWANKDDDDEDWIALYTTPPQRKPLTDEEIKRMAASLFMSHYWNLCNEFARAIEAAHGIKGDA